ncbi:protein LAZY 1-like [Quillaja saponaria]|uniref:Protein LAZY 1-like n=1 Tax=Quillaja saponaria TaxID=32244 RepID=A0AAD7LGR2_QUISA|nr:protein LAZY 1-like [Quillaja saponaria]
MKLLGWMHRKFRQNSNEPYKDSAIGQSAVDDQQNYQKHNYGIKHFKQAQRDHHIRKYFAGLEAATVEEEDCEEEPSAATSELFHGFLAIGTLGSEQVITNPSTPTFSISFVNITEEESEVTENELKLINDELEKVLGAETKDGGCNDSSGRHSHVSTGRSSYASTITLSGKPIEGVESNGSGTPLFPLQGYLFGSAIELSETTTVAKKENRTSLRDLFQKSKVAEENSRAKYERDDRKTEGEAEKSAMHLMKNKLKKKMLPASSRSAMSPSGGSVGSALSETKLHKILQMFHKKVHPENYTSTQKTVKHNKNENRKKIACYKGNNNVSVVPDKDAMLHSERTISKESVQVYKSQSDPPHFILGSGDSFGNREQWIRTDADYLVLEL